MTIIPVLLAFRTRKHPKQRIKGNSKDFKNILKWKISKNGQKNQNAKPRVWVPSNIYSVCWCTWRSENSLGKLVLSFLHVLPWIQLRSLGLTQVQLNSFKWGLMGFPSQSMKGSLENDLNYMCPAKEVSEEKNISEWPRDHSCDIFRAQWGAGTAFCPCLKNLPKTKLERFGLMSLTGEVSKQPSIDFLVISNHFYAGL